MDYKTVAFAGPSAVGKTYIADQLMQLFPEKFEQAKLHTTRKPRTDENATDRIFVTDKEFSEMVEKSSFLFHDTFGGNRYGFTKDSLVPKDKHLLVNIWPWLCEKVSKLPHAVIVGLQAPDNWESLLVQRMKNRGDSEKTIETRKKLISKDVIDLENNKKTVETHGVYFMINDNNTISQQVIPWLDEKLGLKS